MAGARRADHALCVLGFHLTGRRRLVIRGLCLQRNASGPRHLSVRPPHQLCRSAGQSRSLLSAVLGYAFLLLLPFFRTFSLRFVCVCVCGVYVCGVYVCVCVCVCVFMLTAASKHPCQRPCIAGQTMTCQYNFTVEWYRTLSKVLDPISLFFLSLKQI